MKALTTVAGLSEAIGKATRSAKVCVAGSLPVVDPCIDVEGLGTIKFPLKPTMVRNRMIFILVGGIWLFTA